MKQSKFRVDYFERIRRSGITVAQLADEVLIAKQRDGRARMYVADLRKRLTRFCGEFGKRSIGAIIWHPRPAKRDWLDFIFTVL